MLLRTKNVFRGEKAGGIRDLQFRTDIPEFFCIHPGFHWKVVPDFFWETRWQTMPDRAASLVDHAVAQRYCYRMLAVSGVELGLDAVYIPVDRMPGDVENATDFD